MQNASATIGFDVRPLMHRPYTGVAEYTHALLAHLIPANDRFCYRLFYNSQKDATPDLPRFDYANCSYGGYSYPNKLLNASFRFLHRPRLDTLLDADVMMLPNLNFAGVSPTTPTVVTVHDLSFELFPEFFSARQRLWHRAINPRALIAACDAIITVSRNTRADLAERYRIPAE